MMVSSANLSEADLDSCQLLGIFRWPNKRGDM